MFKTIKNVLPASVVIFFIALPLYLGFALGSGTLLFSGLITGIIAGNVICNRNITIKSVSERGISNFLN